MSIRLIIIGNKIFMGNNLIDDYMKNRGTNCSQTTRTQNTSSNNTIKQYPIKNNTLEKTPKKDTFYSKHKKAIGLGGDIALIGGTIIAGLIYRHNHVNTKKLAEMIEFKPAETIEEAIAFGKEHLGIKKYKNIENLDILNWINEGLVTLNNKTKGKAVMPSVIKAGKNMTGSSASMSASSFLHGHCLRINMEQYNNIDNILEGCNNLLLLSRKGYNYDAKIDELLKKYAFESKNLRFTDKITLLQTTGQIYDIANQIKKSPIDFIAQVFKKQNKSELSITNKSGEEIFYTIDTIKNLEPKEQLKIFSKLSEKFGFKLDINFNSPFQTIYHEIGHAQHMKNTGFFNFIKLGKPEEIPRILDKSTTMDFLNDKNKQKIAQSISKYAASSPAEFVAEVFARGISGEKVSDEVQALYKQYKGPMANIIFK